MKIGKGATVTTKGRNPKTKTIEKIIHSFPILHEGWELDYTAAIVLFNDGTKGIVGTNHGSLAFWTREELLSKIERYKYAIQATEKALELEAS